MKRASPEEDESSCALMRMDNKDDGDDADFSMNYCWQTVTAPDAECTMVDDFPLRRHACGFFPVGYDHSGHEADRVKVLLVSPALPDRELETIRAFLNAQLRCDPVHSTICRIPIDDEHQDKIMVIHPTILSDHEADSHRNFSQVFRDIGLTDGFAFRGAGGSGTESVNTYPVVFAGFTEDDGDLVGVYAVRVDT